MGVGMYGGLQGDHKIRILQILLQNLSDCYENLNPAMAHEPGSSAPHEPKNWELLKAVS